MFAGFGAAEDTNERFHQLLDGRPDGAVDRLRHAHALRLRHGRPRGRGRVRHLWRRGQQPGRHGGPARGPAARPRLDLDDDQLAGRADLGDVHRGGREARLPARRARGHDPERHPQGVRRPEGVPLPAQPSMRLVTDTIEFGTRELPRWNTISISGYHIREAGSTAVQELAFTIADGMAYVEAAIGARPARRRVRAAALLLLQQPQRLLRGDRQVPRRAADLVEADERALPRGERALDAGCASTPRPPACR